MTNLKGYLKVEGKTVSKYRKSDKRQNYKITIKDRIIKLQQKERWMERYM